MAATLPPIFTVYTPTWNRRHTLPRVWNSLRAQTYTDFEWIVSDDGSTDGTQELLESWQGEATFDMQIRAFPRRVGKPVLDNDGARAARGKYFIIADSDDEFVPEALEAFLRIWETIPEDERDKYCLVNAQSVCHDGSPVGAPFPTSPFDTTSFDLSYRHDMHFDAWTCYRTSVARAHPYPEVDFYVPESIVWLHTIGRRYRIRCVNEVLRIMHRNSENGITGGAKMRYNRGYAYGLAHVINNPEIAPLRRRPREALRNYLNYGRLSRHGHVSFSASMKELSAMASRVLFGAIYPFSAAVSWRDRALGKVDQPPYERFEGTPRVKGA